MLLDAVVTTVKIVVLLTKRFQSKKVANGLVITLPKSYDI